MTVSDKKQMLPSLLKSLREEKKFPQREVASALGIDTTTYCKIEKGKYPANKEQVEKLAELFHADRNELVKVWLADKIVNIANKDEEVAAEAIKLADSKFNDLSKEP
ncbi:helix-turn-helix domain-containing protein [Hallella mizrahii]|nr:helix-turn-helix transcriptional regulator [Hallella mizrahii]